MEAKDANSEETERDKGEQEFDSEDDLQHKEAESKESFNFDTRFPPSFTNIDRQYAARHDVPRRVHILGSGSIGKLVAHSLKGIANPPPITLIFHRYQLLKVWEASKQQIVLQDGEFKVPRSGYDFELAVPPRREHGQEVPDGAPSVYDFDDDMRPHEAAKFIASSDQDEQYTPPRIGAGEQDRKLPGDYAVSTEPIHNLIVTTKASRTIPALSSVKHRLGPSSTVCFLQNGMGIIEDVNKHLFPDPESRPDYMQGIITHGVNVPKGAGNEFFAVHAGHGTIALGLLPRAKAKQTTVTSTSEGERKVESELWAPSSRYLLRTLTRTPVLCAVGFAPTELLQQQLEKLAINAVLNPLTVLLDARNGAILYNFALTRTMRLLLAEISLVLRSLPELQGLPNVNLRFSPERLETLVVAVAHKTRENVSSMLADVRGGRKTEIDYINGYIVNRGEEVGIKCVVNYAIMQTVIGKCMMVQREVAEEVPIERDENRE